MAQRIDAAHSHASDNSIESSTAPSRVNSYFPEVFFSVTVLVLVIIRVIEQCKSFIRLPGSDWNSSEWMIDYAGGFVRRGLSGAFMAQIMRLTHWGFLPIWIAITTVAYIGLCVYMIRVSLRLGGPSLWRFALLMNPILLVSESYYGSIGRKDTLFIWGTLLIALVGHHILQHERAESTSRATRTLIILFAALISSVILALVHEGLFLFAWLPLNFAVVAYILSRLRWSGRRIAILLALTFGPALIAVAASVYRHGDAQIAQTICLSWRSFGVRTSCSVGDNFPPAVDALSWSTSRAMSLSLNYAWRFPPFFVLFALAGSVEIIAILVLIPKAKLEHLIVLLALPLAASLPLCVLGDDWGRYLGLAATTSLMVMLSSELRPALYCLLPATFRAAVTHTIAPPVEVAFGCLRRHAEGRRWLFCVAVIMLPVPFDPNLGALLGNPPAIVFLFLRHLLTR